MALTTDGRRVAIRTAIIGAIGLVAVGLAAMAVAAPARATVWLCKPGERPDPCTPGLSTSVYNPPLTRALRVVHPQAAKRPPIDCFYVYPTVSDEQTGNSDLRIQASERSIARYQLARYSQYCRIYAPMYRQETLAGIGLPAATPPTTKPNPRLGLRDVERAFAQYLGHDNHGRGFVLIGHSQGALVLERLIADKIDARPRVRRRMLSAILMGGNVLVRPPSARAGVGGSFRHIPACRRQRQLRCVIAFSTFDQPVPAGSLFGRPDALEKRARPGDEVLCTNPASLRGGRGLLHPILPSAPFAPGSTIALGLSVLHYTVPSPPTVFWSAPRSYISRCADSNGAHVLEITARHGAQTPTPAPTPAWGLHLLDANLPLGNLVAIVRSESATYRTHRHR